MSRWTSLRSINLPLNILTTVYDTFTTRNWRASNSFGRTNGPSNRCDGNRRKSSYGIG